MGSAAQPEDHHVAECPGGRHEREVGVPSEFSVDSSTTGVPKYRMLGVMVTWLTGALLLVRVLLPGAMVSMASNCKEVLFR